MKTQTDALIEYVADDKEYAAVLEAVLRAADAMAAYIQARHGGKTCAVVENYLKAGGSNCMKKELAC